MPSRPPLTPSSWAIAKDLYEQASRLPAAQQLALLDAAQVEEAVRAEVRSLLAYDLEQGAQGLQNPGFLSEAAALDLPEERERIGERLGPWQIIRPLGSGGMGDVFEAERADGSYQGRAAIKLLKRGLDSQAILQRFTLERQALARMNHPNIATLLDAGLSADNLPYFVMEYIDGRPINEAAMELGLEQRLALFLQLTDAVAYAHRNLLVHRDLKPGNVLVTQAGQVKLLDFGIAKALDPQAGEEAGQGPVTLLTQRPFTPQYASPEQVRGDAVSTATDIYSLGVLLYQMLTGLHPTGRSATTPAEMARSVLEEEPTRPSNLSPELVADPQWLAHRKRLKGDLDNILLMALEKSVQQRYASVDALAQDIRNFLSGHPVNARARTMGYVVGKFLARHRFGAAAGALAIVALCSTTGLALWQARRADLERNNAQQHLDDVRALARTMIFDVNDALLEGITPGRTALVKAAAQYLNRRLEATDLSLQESLDLVDSLRRMADVEGNSRMENLGQRQSALQRYEQALTLLERSAQAGRNDAGWWSRGAMVRRSQSLLLRSQGETAAADTSAAAGSLLIQQAIALDPNNMKTRRLACNLKVAQADALYAMDQLPSQGRLPEALTLLREAVACADELNRLQPEENANATLLSSALARLLRGSLIAGQLEEGVSLARKNHALMSGWLVREPQNPTIDRFATIARSLLGYALLHSGHAAEGIATMSAGADTARAQLRKDPKNERARRDFVGIAWTVCESLLVQGDGAGALKLCSEAQEAARATSETGALDHEQRLQQDGLERSLAEARLLLGQPELALRLVSAFLQRIGLPDAALPTPDRQRILQGRATGRILQARIWQRMGQAQKALAQASAAVQDMDELLKLDAGSSETQSDVARVRTEASLLGAAPTSGSLQCAWAGEALAVFNSLKQRNRMNLEYAAQQLQAQQQVARCAALALKPM